MSAPLLRLGRQEWAAVRALALATLVLGLVYPLVLTLLAQAVVPGRADGALVSRGGAVVGSSLIGQGFVSPSGDPVPQYFQSRPSASSWDGAASGGSNLGPNSPELVAAVEQRRSAVAAFNGVPPSAVPADAVTASGSGLDPGISPAYAQLQVSRVAAARGIAAGDVARLVAAATHGRDLGFIGDPWVDVLDLNLALDREFGAAG
jgi:K+-transporting ATPase ATPase C chain